LKAANTAKSSGVLCDKNPIFITLLLTIQLNVHNFGGLHAVVSYSLVPM